jgi:hypothetical protein
MRRNEAIELVATLLVGAPNGLLGEEIASATNVGCPRKTISVMRARKFNIESRPVYVLLPDGKTQPRYRYVFVSPPPLAAPPEEFELE